MTALMLYFFYKSLGLIGLRQKDRRLLVVILGIGTLVFSYSIVFNSHNITVSLLFISFYFILKSKSFGAPLKKDIFLIGFLSSLAATISPPSGGIFFILFFAYIIENYKKWDFTFAYLLGSLLPLALYLVLNFRITGDIKPINMHPEFYNYPGSFFDGSSFEKTLSGTTYHKNIGYFLQYAFHCLFGKRGLFVYSPMLIFAFTGLLGVLRNKENNFRKECLVGFLGCMLSIVYFLVFSVNYGGDCFGVRWFIEITPLLFFFAGFFLQQRHSVFTMRLFYSISALSIIISLVGAYSPWFSPAGNFSLLDNAKIITSDRNLIGNLFPIISVIR
jgi:hypothetical protein